VTAKHGGHRITGHDAYDHKNNGQQNEEHRDGEKCSGNDVS